MPDEHPNRRQGERRQGSEITPLYLLDRIEGLVTAINVAADTIQPIAAKASQNALTIERLDSRLDALEKWQARIVGMFVIITAEVTIGIGAAVTILAAHPWHP